MEFLDLKDASEELGLSHHQLVKELLKKGCGLYIRFDDESKRKGELVFENHPSSVYEIQPGRIHKLTPDSTRRVIRMLEKETINFQGLRLEIKTDALVFIVKITQEDEGMHLVVLKDDLDRLPKYLKKQQGLSIIPGKMSNKDSAVKKSSRKSHPKINDLFWRTYKILLDQNLDHTYKNVWDTIYDEWQIFEEKNDLQNKDYDIDEIVEKMDSSKKDNAHVNFYFIEGNCSVSFKLSSLSSKLSKLKNTPPKT